MEGRYNAPPVCYAPPSGHASNGAIQWGGVWWGRVLIYACILLGETSHCSYTTRDVTPALVASGMGATCTAEKTIGIG